MVLSCGHSPRGRHGQTCTLRLPRRRCPTRARGRRVGLWWPERSPQHVAASQSYIVILRCGRQSRIHPANSSYRRNGLAGFPTWETGFFMLPRQLSSSPHAPRGLLGPPFRSNLVTHHRAMSIASKPAQSVADAAPSPVPGGASEATHQPGARTPEAELAAVREMAEPLVRSHGVALVEVVWASGSQGRILRITIERPLLDMAVGSGEAMARSGVTLDDCVRVSRELSSLLDTDEVVAGPFSLEVSSPGL
ncbi:MAG TPA: hypothetical protein ENK23_03495, partial [Sorangium sp.]|nr:hypothetical protein [Sorangium sp.]